NSASDGGLEDVKVDKTNEVLFKTNVLLLAGAESWEAGKMVECSRESFNDLGSVISYLQDNPLQITEAEPYTVTLIDGTELATGFVADISTAQLNVGERLKYLVFGTDGSNKLIDAINACTTIEQVNAITDTRV
ncbi:hypothetical protein N9878_02360, partial [bacterium]|nr:hypothetical protein [bacterium]